VKFHPLHTKPCHRCGVELQTRTKHIVLCEPCREVTYTAQRGVQTYAYAAPQEFVQWVRRQP